MTSALYLPYIPHTRQHLMNDVFQDILSMHLAGNVVCRHYKEYHIANRNASTIDANIGRCCDIPNVFDSRSGATGY